MKFEELYERTISCELCQEDAASILGGLERTFRRWRDRFMIGRTAIVSSNVHIQHLLECRPVRSTRSGLCLGPVGRSAISV